MFLPQLKEFMGRMRTVTTLTKLTKIPEKDVNVSYRVREYDLVVRDLALYLIFSGVPYDVAINRAEHCAGIVELR